MEAAMPDVVGVELESIRLGVLAEDDLRARVEKALPTVAHDRRLVAARTACDPGESAPRPPAGDVGDGPCRISVVRFDSASPQSA